LSWERGRVGEWERARVGEWERGKNPLSPLGLLHP